jgi:hypothetical protein
MMAFLLLVTWLAYNQPPDHYQVPFSSNEACEAARLQLIKDAERIGQSMIERATAQDRQIGGQNRPLDGSDFKCAVRLSRLCSNVAKKRGATSRLPKEMMGRRLSQEEAKRLLAKFEHHAASC